MPFTVWLTDGAARDLKDLFRHIAVRDSPDKADQGVSRGPLQPYRIVYRVSTVAVHVLMIADGRRDVEALLQRRLLQA